MAEQQAKLQAAAQEYQKIQDELQSVVGARQKLESQQHENQGVKGEFENAKEEETIYKLVGTVLLKQEKEEALSTVNGRLEYIENEIKRVEEQLKSIQKRGDDKKQQVIEMQTAMQQQEGAQGS